MIDIDQIIFELFCRVQIIAAIDLRVTSQARHNLHTAAEVLDFAVKVENKQWGVRGAGQQSSFRP